MATQSYTTSNQTYPTTYGQPYYTSQPYGNVQTYPPGGGYESSVPLEVRSEPARRGNEVKVVEDRSCRDLFFLILFLVHLVGIGVIIGFGLAHPIPEQHEYHGLIPYNSTGGGGDLTIMTQYIEMIVVLVVVSLILSVIFLELMKRFTAPLIYIGIALNILGWAAMTILFALSGNIVGAIFFGIFTVLSVVYFFLIRNRIPFAVLTIRSVVSVIQKYPATQVTAYLSIIIQLGWVSLWVFCFFLSQRFTGNLAYVAFAFLIFSYYWVSEVIKNVVHVTVSGVIATQYFMRNNMPKNPTLDSLRRSLTTSFGSICLGSLIVSAIKTLRFLVRSLRTEGDNIFLCCIDCFLSCIDSLIQYFNHYAYCQVAIYGKTFVQSAKDTWELFKSSGLEAIVNDNLVDGVLWLGVILNAILTGLCGLGIAFAFGTTSGVGYGVMFFVGFVIGFILMILGMQVVDSGVACTFVCFAEDRATLQANNPELYNAMMEAYHLSFF